MNQFLLHCLVVFLLSVAFSNSENVPPTVAAGVSPQDNVAQYVGGVSQYNPPSGYQYTEPNYGPQGYDNGYIMPYPQAAQHDDDDTGVSTFQYFTSVMPYTRLISRAIAKVGVVLLGGIAVILIGGLITMGVCSYTPLCTIQYNGWGINRETMRSMMTPDNLSVATAFVQDAIEKYQKINKNRQ